MSNGLPRSRVLYLPVVVRAPLSHHGISRLPTEASQALMISKHAARLRRCQALQMSQCKKRQSRHCNKTTNIIRLPFLRNPPGTSTRLKMVPTVVLSIVCRSHSCGSLLLCLQVCRSREQAISHDVALGACCPWWRDPFWLMVPLHRMKEERHSWVRASAVIGTTTRQRRWSMRNHAITMSWIKLTRQVLWTESLPKFMVKKTARTSPQWICVRFSWVRTAESLTS